MDNFKKAMEEWGYVFTRAGEDVEIKVREDDLELIITPFASQWGSCTDLQVHVYDYDPRKGEDQYVVVFLEISGTTVPERQKNAGIHHILLEEEYNEILGEEIFTLKINSELWVSELNALLPQKKTIKSFFLEGIIQRLYPMDIVSPRERFQGTFRLNKGIIPDIKLMVNPHKCEDCQGENDCFYTDREGVITVDGEETPFHISCSDGIWIGG